MLTILTTEITQILDQTMAKVTVQFPITDVPTNEASQGRASPGDPGGQRTQACRVKGQVRDPSPRIRGRRLQAIRKHVLAANPLCVMCKASGRVTLATEVDHIVALANGGEDNHENRQALCSECHAEKTRRDLGQRERPLIGLDGWPVE